MVELLLRFQSVRKHFVTEWKELKLRDQTPYTAQSIISLLNGLKYFRVKVSHCTNKHEVFCSHVIISTFSQNFHFLLLDASHWRFWGMCVLSSWPWALFPGCQGQGNQACPCLSLCRHFASSCSSKSQFHTYMTKHMQKKWFRICNRNKNSFKLRCHHVGYETMSLNLTYFYSF